MKIALVGSNGRLGAALAREYHKDYHVHGFNRSQLDLENLRQIREALSAINLLQTGLRMQALRESGMRI